MYGFISLWECSRESLAELVLALDLELGRLLDIKSSWFDMWFLNLEIKSSMSSVRTLIFWFCAFVFWISRWQRI